MVRRTLLAVLGVQLVLALSLTLVDSWRRRGKKPQPFTTLPPQQVEIGSGTVTTYTFGQDLYDDMLAAIGAAVASSRTLGGLCDFIEAEAPATEDVETAGARAVRWADAVIVATYGTSDPLN